MQGKVKILESDDGNILREGATYKDAHIHFSGLNTHIINLNSQKEFGAEIDFITIEAESLLFDAMFTPTGSSKEEKVYASFRFWPHLKKN